MPGCRCPETINATFYMAIPLDIFTQRVDDFKAKLALSLPGLVSSNQVVILNTTQGSTIADLAFVPADGKPSFSPRERESIWQELQMGRVFVPDIFGLYSISFPGTGHPPVCVLQSDPSDGSQLMPRLNLSEPTGMPGMDEYVVTRVDVNFSRPCQGADVIPYCEADGCRLKLPGPGSHINVTDYNRPEYPENYVIQVAYLEELSPPNMTVFGVRLRVASDICRDATGSSSTAGEYNITGLVSMDNTTEALRWPRNKLILTLKYTISPNCAHGDVGYRRVAIDLWDDPPVTPKLSRVSPLDSITSNTTATLLMDLSGRTVMKFDESAFTLTNCYVEKIDSSLDYSQHAITLKINESATATIRVEEGALKDLSGKNCTASNTLSVTHVSGTPFANVTTQAVGPVLGLFALANFVSSTLSSIGAAAIAGGSGLLTSLGHLQVLSMLSDLKMDLPPLQLSRLKKMGWLNLHIWRPWSGSICGKERSDVYNSTLTNSTAHNYTVHHSTVLYSTVQNSAVFYSYVYNSTVYNSTVSNCTIYNSVIYNSTIYDSAVNDSTVFNFTGQGDIIRPDKPGDKSIGRYMNGAWAFINSTLAKEGINIARPDKPDIGFMQRYLRSFAKPCGWDIALQILMWAVAIMSSVLVIHVALNRWWQWKYPESEAPDIFQFPRLELYGLIFLALPLTQASAFLLSMGSIPATIVGIIMLVAGPLALLFVALRLILMVHVLPRRSVEFEQMDAPPPPARPAWMRPLERIWYALFGRSMQSHWRDKVYGSRFTARFGVLFEDFNGTQRIVGKEQPEVEDGGGGNWRARCSSWSERMVGHLRTSYKAVELCKRIVLAFLLGIYGPAGSGQKKDKGHAWTQVITGLCLAAAQLAILVRHRPFINRFLQFAETLSVTCELHVFVVLLLLLADVGDRARVAEALTYATGLAILASLLSQMYQVLVIGHTGLVTIRNEILLARLRSRTPPRAAATDNEHAHWWSPGLAKLRRLWVANSLYVSNCTTKARHDEQEESHHPVADSPLPAPHVLVAAPVVQGNIPHALSPAGKSSGHLGTPSNQQPVVTEATQSMRLQGELLESSGRHGDGSQALTLSPRKSKDIRVAVDHAAGSTQVPAEGAGSHGLALALPPITAPSSVTSGAPGTAPSGSHCLKLGIRFHVSKSTLQARMPQLLDALAHQLAVDRDCLRVTILPSPSTSLAAMPTSDAAMASAAVRRAIPPADVSETSTPKREGAGGISPT